MAAYVSLLPKSFQTFSEIPKDLRRLVGLGYLRIGRGLTPNKRENISKCCQDVLPPTPELESVAGVFTFWNQFTRGNPRDETSSET